MLLRTPFRVLCWLAPSHPREGLPKIADLSSGFLQLVPGITGTSHRGEKPRISRASQTGADCCCSPAGQAECRPPPNPVMEGSSSKIPGFHRSLTSGSQRQGHKGQSPFQREHGPLPPASSEAYLSANIDDDVYYSVTTHRNPLLSLQASHVSDTCAPCTEGAWGGSARTALAAVLQVLMARREPIHLSAVQSLRHVRFCDPTDCSTPGLPVPHQLLELTQTHVHRVGDAIQPSHPRSPPSPPAPSPSQHQGLFQ